MIDGMSEWMGWVGMDRLDGMGWDGWVSSDGMNE